MSTHESHDPLTPAQRTAVERLVGEVYAAHRQRCAGADRDHISKMQTVLGEELRAAYTVGLRARDQAES